MPYRVQITKAKWRALGGFRNSSLFRSQRGQRWAYFRLLEGRT